MTSPGPSPPRSKKESSAASEPPPTRLAWSPPAPAIAPPSQARVIEIADSSFESPADDASTTGDESSSTDDTAQERTDRSSARHALKQSRREAKLAARKRRAEARQQLAADKARHKAEAAAAKAAEQVDSETAEQVSPEVLELEQPAVEVTDETVDEVVVDEVPADDLVGDAHDVDDDTRVPREAALELAASASPANEPEPREAEAAAKPAREPEPARPKPAKAFKPAQQSTGVDTRGSEDDPIVEPPRQPKRSIAERLRSSVRSRRRDDTPSPRGASSATSRSGRRLVAVLGGVIGAVGLVCSVILAFGALLVALDADGGRVYDVVSGIADTLVGPLRDVFSFSGSNADMKESLVAWGAGAIVYLVVGIVAQSFLRSAADD